MSTIPYGYLAKKLSALFAVTPVEATIITAIGITAYMIYEEVKK